ELVKAEGARCSEGQHNAQEKADIAHPGGQESLVGRVHVGHFLEVVADEQVGTQTHQLPENKEEEEVVGQYQAQHAERKEGEDRVITLVTDVAVHIAGGVNMHQQADEGDDDQHHRRQLIHLEAQVQTQVAVDGPVKFEGHA